MKTETNAHVIKAIPRQLARIRKAGNSARNCWDYPVVMNYRLSAFKKRLQIVKYGK